MKIRSYGKVNLFLLVGKLNKKKGLHKISTIINRIENVYDEIEITQNSNDTDKIRYFGENNKLIKFDNCVVQRSLDLLRQMGYISKYYIIDIYKHIPLGSGLGGGSSNAAEVINYVLNEENVKLNSRILKKIISIGSDIPFFLKRYDIALVTSYGEKVSKIKTNFAFEIELFFTNVKCMTKDVFDKYDELKLNNKNKIKEQIQYIKDKKFNLLWNDLQSPCFLLFPEIKKLYDKVNSENIGNKFKLTGSGGTLFRVVL